MKPRNLRIEEGIERNAAWRALTPAEQLASINSRRYQGLVPVAKRQRAKLSALLNPVTPNIIQIQEPLVPDEPVKKKKFKKGNRKHGHRED